MPDRAPRPSPGPVPERRRGAGSPVAAGTAAALVAGGLAGALASVPVGAVVGLAAAVAGAGAVLVRRARASGRRPVDPWPTIDPFALDEPWRRLVQRPLRARGRAAEAVAAAPPGPLRDRLGDSLTRLDDAVARVWSVARQGQTASEARSALDPAGLRRRLDRVAGPERAEPSPPPDPATAAAAASLSAQLAGVERLEAAIATARSRLEVLDAGVEEAAARLIELSVGGDLAALDPLDADVGELVDGLEALRQALEETGPGGTPPP